MNWYLEVLEKYAVFNGRARRTEYWMFSLFNAIFAVVIAFVDAFLDGRGVGVILYSLCVLIPGIAVLVRRLHDTDRSGWWWLIGLVPLIGSIVLFIFMVQDSKPGHNQYGANPKEAIAEQESTEKSCVI